MNQILRYFGGTITFDAENGFCERLINLCSTNNISLWNFQKTESGFTASCLAKDYKKIKKLSKKVNVDVRIVRKKGFIFKAGKYKKRFGLMLGILFTLTFLFLSQCFVWEIEVTGNEKVSSRIILNELRDLGVHKLSFIPAIDFRMKKQQALLNLPQLSWLTINQEGCKLKVDVTERTMPPRIKEDTPCDIVASKTGQIRYMEVYEGAKIISENYTVTEGEVIVSGTYQTKFGDTIKVHADAKVIAEVQHEKSISLDLEQLSKSYTGKTKTRYYLNLFSVKIPLFFATSIPGDYDVHSEDHFITIAGNELPIGIYSLHYQFYDKKPDAISMEQAQDILEEKFKQYEAIELKDAAILNREKKISRKNGIVTMTIAYISEQNIAKAVLIDPTIPPKVSKDSAA